MIRKFKLADIEKILEIEKTSFPKTPYSKSMFSHYFEILPNNFLVYVSSSNIIIGYIIFYTDGHIVSIAVDKKYRRQGTGALLLKEAIRLSKNGHALVEVRETNIIALNFYKKFGFEKIGIIKKYYDTEDAIIFVI